MGCLCVCALQNLITGNTVDLSGRVKICSQIHIICNLKNCALYIVSYLLNLIGMLFLLLFICLFIFWQLYKKCGQFERTIGILEDYLKDHPPKDDPSVVEMLVSVYMERNEHSKALERIEHARRVFSCGEEFPLNLTIREGICHAHLGDLEKAEVCYLNISGNRKICLLSFSCVSYYQHLMTTILRSLACCSISKLDRGCSCGFSLTSP